MSDETENSEKEQRREKEKAHEKDPVVRIFLPH
jgi:hypothetical protein